METIRILLNQASIASQLLQEGKIVAIPTDTVYGLGVLANNARSINRLRQVKQRPDEKALAYVCSSLEQIEDVCDLTARDRFLIKRWLPGGLTFIFKKKKSLPIVDESGLDTLAIRIPNHAFILEVLDQLECGIYLPSANISGSPSLSDGQAVYDVFNGLIEGCVMAQSLSQKASTIIDCTQTQLRCLREGEITLESIIDSLKEAYDNQNNF